MTLPCGRMTLPCGRMTLPCGRMTLPCGRMVLPCGGMTPPRGEMIPARGKVSPPRGKRAPWCGSEGFDILASLCRARWAVWKAPIGCSSCGVNSFPRAISSAARLQAAKRSTRGSQTAPLPIVGVPSSVTDSSDQNALTADEVGDVIRESGDIDPPIAAGTFTPKERLAGRWRRRRFRLHHETGPPSPIEIARSTP